MVNGHASPFFQLGSGVRKGDPLSPSLFVLFLEPMLAYLRATTGHLGIPVQHDSDKHHLPAFAGDVTGLLRNIDDTPTFLRHVQHYAQAAGLQLNTTKTQVFSFRSTVHRCLTTTEPPSRPILESVSFLGVLQHADHATTLRFPSILPAFHSRILLWRFRARALRGRAVLLRSIVLPLL